MTLALLNVAGVWLALSLVYVAVVVAVEVRWWQRRCLTRRRSALLGFGGSLLYMGLACLALWLFLSP